MNIFQKIKKSFVKKKTLKNEAVTKSKSGLWGKALYKHKSITVILKKGTRR